MVPKNKAFYSSFSLMLSFSQTYKIYALLFSEQLAESSESSNYSSLRKIFDRSLGNWNIIFYAEFYEDDDFICY